MQHQEETNSTKYRALCQVSGWCGPERTTELEAWEDAQRHFDSLLLGWYPTGAVA